VPLTVCELPGLLALSLSANSLTEKTLPERLSSLTTLTELWLNKNNFDQLPRYPHPLVLCSWAALLPRVPRRPDWRRVGRTVATVATAGGVRWTTATASIAAAMTLLRFATLFRWLVTLRTTGKCAIYQSSGTYTLNPNPKPQASVQSTKAPVHADRSRDRHRGHNNRLLQPSGVPARRV